MSTRIEKVILAGRAGQRLLRAGRILARAGMDAGLEVSWVPETGPEGAGVAVVCTVILAHDRVDSPLVSVPDMAVALTATARERLHPTIKAGGVLLDAAAEPPQAAAPRRDDVRQVRIPAEAEAAAAGDPDEPALVALGGLAELSRLLSPADLVAAAAQELPDAEAAARAGRLIEHGAAFVRERRYMKERYALAIFPG